MENLDMNMETVNQAETTADPAQETQVVDFTGYLSEELRASQVASKFQGKSADDVLKSYANLESVLGKKVNQLTPEEAIQLRELQGFVTVNNVELPENITGPVADWFKEIAPKAGLTKEGVKELVSSYMEFEAASAQQRMNELARQTADAETALRKEYGTAFESRLNLAGNLVKSIGGEELLKDIETSGLGANPRFVKMMMDIASQFEGDKLPSSQRGNALGVTPEAANQQIQMMLADPETRQAYYNKFNPKHEIIKAEITKLYQLANPE